MTELIVDLATNHGAVGLIFAVTLIVFIIIVRIIIKGQNKISNLFLEQTLYIDQEREMRQKVDTAHKERDHAKDELFRYSVKMQAVMFEKICFDAGTIQDYDRHKQDYVNLIENFRIATDNLEKANREYLLMIQTVQELQNRIDAAGLGIRIRNNNSPNTRPRQQ